MRSHHLEPKVMAKALRAALQERQIAITHGTALEIVAAQHGHASWNVLAAEDRAPVADDMHVGEAMPAGEDMRFGQTCPIMRIFDEGIAKEFYLDFLGFHLDWEHRYGENFPLYAQVSRSGLTLHLTGHHGDATPGSSAFVRMQGVEAFQHELTSKDYKHNKPGLKDEPYGLVMTVTDPFNNRIHFCQDKPGA